MMADMIATGRRTALRGLVAILAVVLSPALTPALSAAAGPAGVAEQRYTGNLFNPGNRVDADGVVRDRSGRPVGRIVEDAGVHTLIDNAGRPVGRVEPGFSRGELVIRDGAGRRQGTLERSLERTD